MEAVFFGRCDNCGILLSSRYFSFNRHVQQYRYIDSEKTKSVEVLVDVLMSDSLTQYCGEECAHVGAYCQLTDRGIPSDTEIAAGPIATCSKCNSPMDLTQAHIAYETMEQTEIRQPWLTTVTCHDATTVARVCSNCEPDLGVGIAEADIVEDEYLANIEVEMPRLEPQK